MARGVRDIDRGWKRIKAEILKAREQRGVAVGIVGQEQPREGGGPSNAEIGTWHEFGRGHNPERSFLRSTFDNNREKYRGMLGRGLGRVVDGEMDLDRVLGLLGERAAADVKATIKKGIPPELQKATVQRKTRKSDGAEAATPLIETGQLIGSITYDVRKRGDGEGI